MSSHFIKIYATKFSAIGGYKEGVGGRRIRTSDSEGYEIFNIEKTIMYRDGKEQLVPAPRGANCSGGIHRIRQGLNVYDLGNNKFTCPYHISMIPTLNVLVADYSDSLRYSDVYVEDDRGKRPLSEL